MIDGVNYFCDSLLWDWDAFWNVDVPSLTNCFRHSVLISVPCASLWIVCIFNFLRIKYDRSDNFQPKAGPSPWTLLTIVKLVSTFSRGQCFLSIILLTHALSHIFQ
ncbi:multidrug resistance-associated protein 1 [Nephila pilipes]|uniref:Multidrug resistance-associated protein 1 n=1 Tax=Nephila pilipes TaxID=299642 RepID=A0A8X6TY03_NEPPI|nr:multidrug resistance-associated protein 1 [Nephila pilipes]